MNDADSLAAGVAVDALMNYETIKTFGAESRVVAQYDRSLPDLCAGRRCRPTPRSSCSTACRAWC